MKSKTKTKIKNKLTAAQATTLQQRMAWILAGVVGERGALIFVSQIAKLNRG